MIYSYFSISLNKEMLYCFIFLITAESCELEIQSKEVIFLKTDTIPRSNNIKRIKLKKELPIIWAEMNIGNEIYFH